jgi:hypothetical protein
VDEAFQVKLFEGLLRLPFLLQRVGEAVEFFLFFG